MTLGHVRAHHDEAVGVLQVARIRRRRASTKP
jgi:hypothetical protein